MFQTKILRKGIPLSLLLLCWYVGGFEVPTALAQGATTVAEQVQGSLGKNINDVLSIVAMINTFVQALLLITLQMLQYLLQADFFNNPTMMSGLNSVWVLSRDIMNVLFAVMLIGVAFVTIITANNKYITEYISRFIIAVVLVNFSWFFPRIIIDVANILTSTVYSIPSIIGQDGNFACRTFKEDGPGTEECKVLSDIKILPTVMDVSLCKSEEDEGCRCTDSSNSPIACYKIEPYSSAVTKMGAGHAMLNGMTTSFIRIHALTKISIQNGNNQNKVDANAAFVTTLQIMITILMTLVVQLAILLPLIGLGIGLFIRIILIWVTTAFMPFSFLGYLINGNLGTKVFGFDKDIWDEFINAAFLPAVVAVPFVIGLIMLSAVAQVPDPGGMTWGVPLIGTFKSWWPFMWMGAAIGIIWTGAFAALARSEITGGITGKIKNFGDHLFSAGLQLPLLVPLPVGIGPKGANLGTVVYGMSNAAEGIRLKARGINTGGGTAKGGIADTLKTMDNANGNADRIVQAIQNISLGKGDTATNMTTIRTTLGNAAIGHSDKQLLESIRDNRGGAKEDKIKNLDVGVFTTAIQKLEDEQKKKAAKP